MKCEVCGDPVDTVTDFDKHDPRTPVYTDDGAYHLGCEDGVFEWSVGMPTSDFSDTHD